MDFSDCLIDGILVSDSFFELKGMKVSLTQAADLARLLGLKIVP